MKSLALPLQALLITLGTAAVGQAQTIQYQAPTGPGGTWNLYEFVLGGTNFMGAHNASNGVPNPIAGQTALGFLAEIGSAFENTVVNNMTYRGDAWIGLTDRVGAAPGALEGTFAWTNGAPVLYTNFNLGEPNNAGSAEDAIHITGGGGWNDNRSGFPLNNPVADPGNTDESGGPNFRYIREYATASPVPLAGVRSAAALSFNGSVTGSLPAPTAGNFSVREVRTLAQGNIYEAVNNALSGAGAITQGQLPRLDVADPETNAAGGPVITATPPTPFLTNTPGVADDNILTIAKGRVSVPSSGEWTIQVRSDDGFALRVVGQTFNSVNGGGQIDPLDPSTIMFYGGTGDANTRGVINLAAGIYDVEFVNWEGGGGAYYEVTTAKGAATSGNGLPGAPFLAMGDTTVIPGTVNTVRLTGNATIRTAAENTAGGGTANNITEARNLITIAEAAALTNNGTTNTVQVGDGQPNPFPAGTPADEFAMKITGQFLVNDGDATPGESMVITFGTFSDDGSQLRILGQDFDGVNDFDTDPTHIAALVDVAGDMSLTADYFTGNTNAFGRITLTEGTFDFEAYMFEGGGGANHSIFYSLGDKIATGMDSSFVQLTTATNLLGAEGWALVPEPGIGLLSLMGAALFGRRRRRG